MEQTGSTRCPVASFETYMARVDSSVNHFFQQPKRHVNPNFDEIWYTRIPVGGGTIGDFLKVISERAKCSQIYTNHSLMHTTANVMKKTGHSLQLPTSLTIQSTSPLSHICRVSSCPINPIKSYIFGTVL